MMQIVFGKVFDTIRRTTFILFVFKFLEFGLYLRGLWLDACMMLNSRSNFVFVFGTSVIDKL